MLSDTFTTTTTCSVYGLPAITNTTDANAGFCSLSNPEYATSTASTSVALSVSNSGGYNTVTMDESSNSTVMYYSDSGGGLLESYPASARTSLVASYELTTPGPQRVGYVEFGAGGDSRYPYNGEQASSYSTLLQDGTSIWGLTCDLFSGCSTYTGPMNGALYPIELGVPFEVQVSAGSSGATGGYSVNYASAELDSIFEFRLVEADGVTPVAIDSPEPEYAGFIGLAFIGLVLMSRFVPLESGAEA